VVRDALAKGAHLAFAIPNHPWVDSTDGAAVRIAMSVVSSGEGPGDLQTVIDEQPIDADEVRVVVSNGSGFIHEDFRVGADVTSAETLLANDGLSFMGVTLSGQGFVVEPFDALLKDEPRALKRYVVGNELNQHPRGRFVIDFFGLDEDKASRQFPKSFQRVVDRVKPERAQQKRDTYRKNWWLFAEQRQGMRKALAGLERFIAICRTAKHFVFQFLSEGALLESKGVAIALEDSWFLGCLSSRAHILWAIAKGSHHGVGNDLTYNNSACFNPFPFPAWDNLQSPISNLQSPISNLQSPISHSRSRRIPRRASQGAAGRASGAHDHRDVQRPRKAPRGRGAHREREDHPRARARVGAQKNPRRLGRRRLRCVRLAA
jgi:hypothetical protein